MFATWDNEDFSVVRIMPFEKNAMAGTDWDLQETKYIHLKILQLWGIIERYKIYTFNC